MITTGQVIDPDTKGPNAPAFLQQLAGYRATVQARCSEHGNDFIRTFRDHLPARMGEYVGAA